MQTSSHRVLRAPGRWRLPFTAFKNTRCSLVSLVCNTFSSRLKTVPRKLPWSGSA
uniref:Uncharacterized protein n=1 Tax=Anguilla anguilla TaxID=7936 RepID=A0A0E9XGU5_ANGAN